MIFMTITVKVMLLGWGLNLLLSEPDSELMVYTQLKHTASERWSAFHYLHHFSARTTGKLELIPADSRVEAGLRPGPTETSSYFTLTFIPTGKLTIVGGKIQIKSWMEWSRYRWCGAVTHRHTSAPAHCQGFDGRRRRFQSFTPARARRRLVSSFCNYTRRLKKNF